jgi:hypothetical protein
MKPGGYPLPPMAREPWRLLHRLLRFRSLETSGHRSRVTPFFIYPVPQSDPVPRVFSL